MGKRHFLEWDRSNAQDQYAACLVKDGTIVGPQKYLISLITSCGYYIIFQTARTIRAGANYFRLVRPLHALKCEQATGGLGACSPRKIFKIRHSEIASEAMFGPKKLLESAHL